MSLDVMDKRQKTKFKAKVNLRSGTLEGNARQLWLQRDLSRHGCVLIKYVRDGLCATMWLCGKAKREREQRVGRALSAHPAVRKLDAVCPASLGEPRPCSRKLCPGASVLILGDFPQSLAVPSPSTDLQQAPGVGI